MPNISIYNATEVYNYAVLEHEGGYSVGFRFQSVEDTLARSIVQYEAPYADGAFSDDLGASPRKIRFQAVFRGDEYAAHTRFLSEITTYKQLWNLQHPAYNGIIQGRILTATVSHNKAVRHCAISIEFVETADHAAPSAFVAAASIYQVGGMVIAEAIEKIRKDTENELSSNRPWTADLQAKIAVLKAYATSVAAPINSVAGTIKIVSGVPGEFAGACLDVLEAGAAVTETITSLPEVMTTLAFNISKGIDYINTILAAPNALLDSFGANFRAAYVGLAGVYLGRMLKIEEEKRDASLAAESYESFDNLGRYTPRATFDGKTETEAGFASSEELNDVLIDYADLSNTAIQAARKEGEFEIVRLLEAEAKAINDYILMMIEVTGQIRSISMPREMPIFLLLNREGLSYKACRRVAALNKIINPVFYAGEVRIYER
jgi:prophage DNA circulation protein